jgi:2-oxoisovalerate dehydrogenase E1 component subunit alpha
MADSNDQVEANGPAAAVLDRPADHEGLPSDGLISGRDVLSPARCAEIFRIMVRSRAMEERMIKMAKSGEGFFWIGGPGEEAFNTCLGLQVKKGRGPAFDYLHLHYRNEATLVAMGMPLIDGIRQMAMRATDPHSRGRNFPGHFCVPDWNILPITPVIEVQHVMAPGTAMVQKRLGGDSITIVTGGEAGSAEGDFASCLVWSSRPGHRLPVLIVVMNNGWGISTAACTQHGEHDIIDRGLAFGIPGEVVDGNDPLASWFAIARAMRYVRSERQPFMLEARVSRLFGHSSSSGAQRVTAEIDCIAAFEQKLLRYSVLSPAEIKKIRDDANVEVEAAVQQALREPHPQAGDVERFVYTPSPVDEVYPGDYTGLPQ